MDRQSDGSSAAPTVAAAAVVLVGCYLGASAGMWLRFTTTGAALFFPPYAIVAAVLWRTPPRRWWVILVAATVGDFLPHGLGGASISFALLTEIVNHLRAVLAAVGLRRFARRPGRLETMTEMVGYLASAVFVAPAVAGLAGAFVVTGQGTSGVFWLVFEQWWLSNAITALTLLPLFTLDVGALVRALRVRPRRTAEAALLVCALCLTGSLVFSTSHDPFAHHAHLYWSWPFLLWAAVRFGPRGTSAALLGITLLSLWGAFVGRGPFAPETPTDNLIELHVFLLAASVPLLLVSALLRQQRATTAELAQSRRQYRSIVEDQTEMICRFRPDGTYTFANRAYGQAFGVVPRAVVGGSVWRLVPEGVHATPAQLATITAASPIADREVKVPAPGQATRCQRWRDRGIFDEHGDILEYQSVGRDVTDQTRAEEEHRELESRRAIDAALHAADRRKDEFLAMLGHELRNPLAPISLALEVLNESSPANADAAGALASIERQLGHMTRLLDDLRDISRIKLGKVQLRLEAVDLARVVGNALEATRPLIDSMGHHVSLRVPDRPALVRGDLVRLTQVVVNLLNNAAKYSEPSGRIEIRVDQEQGAARLSVRDAGIGLEGEALEEIFDLFSQVPAGHERARGGLGVGLALVKQLVELHGGTIEARSEGPGRGSEFVVRLPAETAKVAEKVAPAGAPAPEVRRPSLRVLAVDDNGDITQGLATVLRIWGHNVRTASDGAMALEVATSFAPEVVLVDLGMPRVDGFEVARRLRQTAQGPSALLVSMSGLIEEETDRQIREAGFDHHLLKPFEMRSLRSLLDDYLRARDGPSG
jgi:PAS domain S-box-containing protein